MRKYEILLLLNSDKVQYEKILESFRKTFLKIIKEKLIGEKKLAYEINKQPTGYYHLFIVEANNEQLEALQDEYKLNKNFFRLLVINLEKEFRSPDSYIKDKLKLVPSENTDTRNNSLSYKDRNKSAEIKYEKKEDKATNIKLDNDSKVKVDKENESK